jgi:large subunit ribosomal protein L30
MASVEITQIKSIIDRPERQKQTMRALGLGKINRTVTKELTPQIAGMVNRIQHLVSIKEI